jgi:D-alanyl-lipoteichoic acid acyltransferase DltB (MBOAT superfamily)
MSDPDLLRSLFAPLRESLHAALTSLGLPLWFVDAGVELSNVVGLGVIAVCLTPVVAHLQERAANAASGEEGGPALPRILVVASTLGLLWWIIQHPTSNVLELFTRWDHVAFSALAGGALAGASPRLRTWALAVLSSVIIFQYAGPLTISVVIGTSLVAFVALGGRTTSRATTLATVAVIIYGFAWYLRSKNFLQGVQVFGMFSFVFLRQISAATTVAPSTRPPLGNYLCYLTFYLGGLSLVAGPEVYSDFERRNLGAKLHYDARHAARGIAWGAFQIWAAYRIPIAAADLYASADFLSAWSNSLLLFVRVALNVMGVWAIVEGCALFHGFRLHPNFRGILTRRNPSELWWAWRGTCTNWLVRHVYAPLGANRRHQSRNILAAFAVSWFWHVLGVPYLAPNLRLIHFAPITLWAGLTALAVVGHVQAKKYGLHILPATTPPVLRRAIHMFLTACLATFAVSFLSFQIGPIDRFFPFVRTLFCLPG